MIEIKVPEVGESIQEVQISKWFKQVGDYVEKDETLVEVETEKASQELPATESGVVQSLKFDEGAFAKIGDVIAILEAGDQPVAAAAKAEAKSAGSDSVATSASAASTSAASATEADGSNSNGEASWVMPAAQRVLDEYKITADVVTPTGKGGRLLKEDVLKYIEANNLKPGSQAPPAQPTSSDKAAASLAKFTSEGARAPVNASATAPAATAPAVSASQSADGNDRSETRKPMSMIRRTIASRLVEAQQTAALLTTFNEIDMQPVMSLRSKYKEKFLEKHGVKLGFMSFFAKASVEALKRFPAINAEVDGNDIVYRNYQDIGIAIGGGKGLVVPVLRNVERMSFADIEKQIGVFGKAAMENKISPKDLTGGTFTISNGGVYGSLLSTPIVNPPQSGILGLHAIQERPVAVNGQVEIRPMMYIALTYDHRVVDGKEAVVFLKTIKEVLEEPARLFLEI